MSVMILSVPASIRLLCFPTASSIVMSTLCICVGSSIGRPCLSPISLRLYALSAAIMSVLLIWPFAVWWSIMWDRLFAVFMVFYFQTWSTVKSCWEQQLIVRRICISTVLFLPLFSFALFLLQRNKLRYTSVLLSTSCSITLGKNMIYPKVKRMSTPMSTPCLKSWTHLFVLFIRLHQR